MFCRFAQGICPLHSDGTEVSTPCIARIQKNTAYVRRFLKQFVHLARPGKGAYESPGLCAIVLRAWSDLQVQDSHVVSVGGNERIIEMYILNPTKMIQNRQKH